MAGLARSLAAGLATQYGRKRTSAWPVSLPFAHRLRIRCPVRQKSKKMRRLYVALSCVPYPTREQFTFISQRHIDFDQSKIPGLLFDSQNNKTEEESPWDAQHPFRTRR